MLDGPNTCTVLLCTYNGAAYLDQQLDSLFNQTVKIVNIYASDDGSNDETMEILQRWKRSWTKGEFVVVEGPRRGFSENFRSLVLRVPHSDYLAFCDQDDVWHSDKLESAILQLEPFSGRAALYGSRAILVDKGGKPIGLSPLFPRPPGFGNALVQSLAAGNTMVLNKAGFLIFAESAGRTEFLMHDWWAYLIISGAGGHVTYDPVPHIDYRQHGANVIGGRMSLAKRPGRLLELLKGKYIAWNEVNLAALERCSDMLTPQARNELAAFQAVRRASAFLSLVRLVRSGIYRQTRKGDFALAMAAFLHRL
jgi:glycosyltransferase involved in cell wall biosynthesis